MIIVDSNGRRDTVEIVLENKGDSVFRCTYVPVLEGLHTVHVTFAGQQIPRSPFTVHISEGMLSCQHGPEMKSELLQVSQMETHDLLLSAIVSPSPSLSCDSDVTWAV